MSKYTEIQNQYKGFVAAKEAVSKTDPGTKKIVYVEHQYGHYGYLEYCPEYDTVEIVATNKSGSYIRVEAKDIPALIKALREFFE